MADLMERLTTALADRYRVEREIGRGGMARVFLAQDLKLDRPVAIKTLRPELAAVLGGERFLREITLAAKLEHPHILAVYDSGVADGCLYYVMPYVEGESLRERLQREKQLPLDDALRIAREVADALSYAHSRGVIHRDIKPENILLEVGHAVVADFGIAKAIDQAGGERLTETGLTLGTPAYMSPEQAAGSGELDGRSDLYSLGCVLYEMLAGRPPFVGASAESVVQQHLAAEAPPITGIRPAVPAQVAATLERALAKTPADRFNPVALFAEALGPQTAAAVVTPSSGLAATGPVVRRWRRIGVLGLALTAAVVGVVALGRWLRGNREPRHPATAIAVLPFENLAGEGPNAYFAGGLHDELLTQLAKVSALTVMGRTSVMGYAGTTKPLREIADELGVGSIVEGSVQVLGDRLRVNVQLLDAATGRHLWAERYDRTLDDAFAIQSDVAQQVVSAVGAALGAAERTAIAAAPTTNAEAYRLYLHGMEYVRRPGASRRNLEIAQGFYEQAIALDSSFALAHAALSHVHGRMVWFRYDPSPERTERQREAAETALRLAPDLPEAQVATGFVHYVDRDWPGALEWYRRAREGLPNDPEMSATIGFLDRRLGEWDEALAGLRKATEFDPRNAGRILDVGSTLLAMHRYEEGIDWLDRSRALAPDVAEIDVFRAWGLVLWQGWLDSLAAALDRHPPNADLGDWGTVQAWRAFIFHRRRQPDSLLTLLRRITPPVFEWQIVYLPTALYAAWAQELRGDAASARAAFDTSRVLLDSVAAELPDDWRVHAALGFTLAGLGRRADALREARWLEQSEFYRNDRFQGPLAWQARALILALAGDADGAFEEIERLLAGPAYGFSVQMLRLDPRWDPIRGDARFQALLERYDPPPSTMH